MFDGAAELLAEDGDAEERRGGEHHDGADGRDQHRRPEDARRRSAAPRPSARSYEIGPLHGGERGRQVPERLGPGDRDAVDAQLPRPGDRTEQPLVEPVVAEQHHAPRVRLAGRSGANAAPGARSGRPKPARRRCTYQAKISTVSSVWPASHQPSALPTLRIAERVEEAVAR